MTEQMLMMLARIIYYLASVVERLAEKASISSLVGQHDSPGWQ